MTERINIDACLAEAKQHTREVMAYAEMFINEGVARNIEDLPTALTHLARGMDDQQAVIQRLVELHRGPTGKDWKVPVLEGGSDGSRND